MMRSNASVAVFPGRAWDTVSPEAAGMDAGTLARAKEWFKNAMGENRGRLVVVRDGKVALAYCHRMAATAKPGIASAAKSVYANILGMIVAEGKLGSADEKVVDYYPEMMDVKDGQGNKPGRYAFEVNRNITFRHLICNVSGYMKPGETPGRVFNYQTWGMNVLTHALARIYGLYAVEDPEGSPGFKVLIQEKLARPIGADWEYSLGNPPFNDRLGAGARLDVFGYYTGVHTTALDLARLGWLWCNWGRWGERRIVPERWMRESVRVAPDILANCPEEQWMYGHGIWTNERGRLWPDLPREGFTASGAGGHYCTVFPSRRLVVVQNPGLQHQGNRNQMANPELLELILKACR